MRKPLTERQQAIYEYIAETITSRGAPPTIREIMDEFDISSTNGVRTTLAALEKKGHIRRHARLSRGIELADYAEREPLSQEIRGVPLLGRVAAGEPILASGNVEATLQVEQSLVPCTGCSIWGAPVSRLKAEKISSRVSINSPGSIVSVI